MNKELAMKWCAALRSGKYKQGKKKLKHAGRYCCLGVLSEIEGTKILARDETYNGDSLKTGVGVFNNGGRCLAKINDSGITFPEIADIIERHWE